MAWQRCPRAVGLLLALALAPLCPTVLRAAPTIAGAPAPDEALRPAPLPEIVRLFATCAGRLSAVMEHEWLLSRPGSEATALRRSRMLDLLEAVTEERNARRILTLRIEAKAAQARLLRRAAFSLVAAEASRAEAAAGKFMVRCDALLP
ncbi:hypothetical protein [Pseudooceanicola sp. HF7]|uniref:hypothetical protein n=1 Tax=Pseudooceanicola sp. HF7 TaxID=2721560 RepID=UPI0014316BF4|nr:hypothetical protein [Pseudooceanicola sp. HF7]NIZ09158.1 hypothetical protein [Pseudooceanicola sp. HF7]